MSLMSFGFGKEQEQDTTEGRQKQRDTISTATGAKEEVKGRTKQGSRRLDDAIVRKRSLKVTESQMTGHEDKERSSFCFIMFLETSG